MAFLSDLEEEYLEIMENMYAVPVEPFQPLLSEDEDLMEEAARKDENMTYEMKNVDEKRVERESRDIKQDNDDKQSLEEKQRENKSKHEKDKNISDSKNKEMKKKDEKKGNSKELITSKQNKDRQEIEKKKSEAIDERKKRKEEDSGRTKHRLKSVVKVVESESDVGIRKHSKTKVYEGRRKNLENETGSSRDQQQERKEKSKSCKNEKETSPKPSHSRHQNEEETEKPRLIVKLKLSRPPHTMTSADIDIEPSYSIKTQASDSEESEKVDEVKPLEKKKENLVEEETEYIILDELSEVEDIDLDNVFQDDEKDEESHNVNDSFEQTNDESMLGEEEKEDNDASEYIESRIVDNDMLNDMHIEESMIDKVESPKTEKIETNGEIEITKEEYVIQSSEEEGKRKNGKLTLEQYRERRHAQNEAEINRVPSSPIHPFPNSDSNGDSPPAKRIKKVSSSDAADEDLTNEDTRNAKPCPKCGERILERGSYRYKFKKHVESCTGNLDASDSSAESRDREAPADSSVNIIKIDEEVEIIESAKPEDEDPGANR